MSLAEVKHQAHAQRSIQRAIAGARVAHAYIFHGPDGVGKETLAFGFAQVLLCRAPEDVRLDKGEVAAIGQETIRNGCGRCDECRMVMARTHPDLHLINRQLNREHPDPVIRKRKALDIGVDVLRHFVIDRVAFTPIRGRSKVFIIREADRITTAAQNALLKTLEEPPGDTVLILLVQSLDRLLPTTVSRSQVVRFDALPSAFVQARLTELMQKPTSESPIHGRPTPSGGGGRKKGARVLPGVGDGSIPPDAPSPLEGGGPMYPKHEETEWCARSADGSLGLAMERTAHNLYALNARLLDGLSRLYIAGCPAPSGGGGRTPPTTGVGDRPDRLVKTWTDESKGLGDIYRKQDPDITDTEATRRGLKAIFQLTAMWYADVLRIHAGDSGMVINRGMDETLHRMSGILSANRAADAIQRIVQAERQLDLNANTQLCVETLLEDLAAIAAPTSAQVP